MVAAHKLYPEAAWCLSGAVNRNVREFQHAVRRRDPGDRRRRPSTWQRSRRLILVETFHANRLGELGDLMRRAAAWRSSCSTTTARPATCRPFIDPANVVTSDDGSLVTLMLRIIAERGHRGDARSRRPSSPWASTRTPAR